MRDLSRAFDLVERARSVAARYELRPLEIFARAMRAELLLWTGDWDTAEDEASDLAGVRLDIEPIAVRILATISARRGRSGTGDIIERMWTLARETDEMMFIDPAAGVVAEYLWLTGTDDGSWSVRLDRVLERGLHGGAEWPSGAFAFWMWKLGRLPNVPTSMPDWYRWTIDGRPDLAAEFWTAQGAGYDRAVALMHGDDTRAVEAVRVFEELGADGAARRLRRELSQRGMRVPRGTSHSSRSHPAGLTARQAEVLQLLAEELSNADIADRLFVSHRTVENHVAAILRKLNVASRHAAVETARTHGLLDAG